MRFWDLLLLRKSVYVCRLRKGHWTFVLRPDREELVEAWVQHVPPPGTRKQKRVHRLRLFDKLGAEWKKEMVVKHNRTAEFGHWYVFERHEPRTV